MTGQNVLERTLFMLFVVTTNAFVGINMGWVLLASPWDSILLRAVPVLGFLALASFLAFVLLEDHIGRRRAEAEEQ